MRLENYFVELNVAQNNVVVDIPKEIVFIANGAFSLLN